MAGDGSCNAEDATKSAELTWRFILVEPATPENIGAAARAIKTMGIGSLCIVNPQCDPFATEAKYLAHGSSDVLESTLIVSSLEEARTGLDLCIATSADQRKVRKTLIAAEDLVPKIVGQQVYQSVGLVFGRERRGLTNSEMESCEWVSALAMAQKHPTLNLAQAVMLYAYLIASRGPIVLTRRQRHLDDVASEYQTLKEKCMALLPLIGVHGENRSYHKLMGRISHLSMEDVRLMFYFCSKIEKALKTEDGISAGGEGYEQEKPR